jgi:hypothetical protein
MVRSLCAFYWGRSGGMVPSKQRPARLFHPRPPTREAKGRKICVRKSWKKRVGAPEHHPEVNHRVLQLTQWLLDPNPQFSHAKAAAAAGGGRASCGGWVANGGVLLQRLAGPLRLTAARSRPPAPRRPRRQRCVRNDCGCGVVVVVRSDLWYCGRQAGPKSTASPQPSPAGGPTHGGRWAPCRSFGMSPPCGRLNPNKTRTWRARAHPCLW